MTCKCWIQWMWLTDTLIRSEWLLECHHALQVLLYQRMLLTASSGWRYYQQSDYRNVTIVKYWPSTELSIKRCTCVDKRKNSRSRWVLENNITRCPGGSSQLETGRQCENQQQIEGFGPLVTPSWATQAKMRKKCCYGQGRTWVNIAVRLCLPSFLTHNKYHLFENKVWEVYSFVIEVVIIGWLCSYIYYYWLIMFIYLYTCSIQYNIILKFGAVTRIWDQVWSFYCFEILQGIAESPIVFGRMKDASVLNFDTHMSG